MLYDGKFFRVFSICLTYCYAAWVPTFWNHGGNFKIATYVVSFIQDISVALFYTKQRGGRGLNVTLRDVIHHGYYYGLHKTYYPKLGVFCTHNPTPTINCCDGRIQKFCFLSQKRFIFYYGRTYTLSKLTFQKVNGTLNFSKVMFILEVKF